CRCRRGASVVNLAHSASFHSRENNAPSNPGTKHLLKKLEVKLPRGWRLYKRRCMSGKLKDRRGTRNRIRTMRSCIPCPQSTLRQAAFSILKNESGPKPRQLEGSA
ncbi:hypothetical protein, partial [Komagataeibacter saccharivorans]|uniref:hypothetical protein n=2 Tax=Komagataeibacter saccharivorans TaxID=265959 RepID=UPI001C650417